MAAVFFSFDQSCTNFATNSPCATPSLHSTSTHILHTYIHLQPSSLGTSYGHNFEECQTNSNNVCDNCHQLSFKWRSWQLVDNLLTERRLRLDVLAICRELCQRQLYLCRGVSMAWRGSMRNTLGREWIWHDMTLILSNYVWVQSNNLNLFCLHLDLVS